MDLVVSVRVRAPPELVFRALTTPDGLNEFWTKRANFAPRAGGRFRFWFEDAGAPEPDAEGTVIDFEEDWSVTLAFDQEDGRPDPHPITITVDPDERRGSVLELVQTGLDEEDDELLDAKNDEWEDLLARLKSVAERWAKPPDEEKTRRR